jgi:glycosyltransferase involved in cell wall biosynthesis
MPPKISIVTPCYNMLTHLKRCVSSVGDQKVSLEHIVIDGNSSDGTKQWLQEQKSIRWVSEKDNGMYDALNKGLFMTTGQVIGHLNADEQYLEGALKSIIDFFDRHPEIDFVTADFLLVDKNGELIAFRKSFPLFWPFLFSNYLYAYTCTLFYRQKVIRHLKYDSDLKSVADVDFVYELLKKGFKGAHLKKYIAAFTHTGNNLSEHPSSSIEMRTYKKKNLPAWFKIVNPIFKAGFFGARIFYGTLWNKGSIDYSLYQDRSLEERKRITVPKPSYKWVQK